MSSGVGWSSSLVTKTLSHGSEASVNDIDLISQWVVLHILCITRDLVNISVVRLVFVGKEKCPMVRLSGSLFFLDEIEIEMGIFGRWV